MENFKEKITSKLESLLCSSPNSSVTCACKALELIDRRSKFVVGHAIYDFFGLKWRLPLWEKPFLTFLKICQLGIRSTKNYTCNLINNNWAGVWKNIPVNQKQIRPLHMKYFGFL